MASWTLVGSLEDLRGEFNRECPERDKASDGSIGDTAHQHEDSDHNPDETGATSYEDSDNINEVHAIDVDSDLRRPGVTMQDCVDIIVERHRTGQMAVLQYVIYNRRIWSRSWGWTARAYTGASAHTEHAHFSARYGSGSGSSNPENYSGSWGLDEIMTKAEFMDWLDEYFARGTQDGKAGGPVTSKIGRDALDQGVPNAFTGGKSSMWALTGDIAEHVIALEVKVDALTPKP